MRGTKIAAICVAVIAGITGILAAYYWQASANVQIEPAADDFEPLEQADKAMFWTVETMTAFTQSATLNRRAARWTAVSVLLSATAGILGSAL